MYRVAWVEPTTQIDEYGNTFTRDFHLKYFKEYSQAKTFAIEQADKDKCTRVSIGHSCTLKTEILKGVSNGLPYVPSIEDVVETIKFQRIMKKN